jgi:protease-4
MLNVRFVIKGSRVFRLAVILICASMILITGLLMTGCGGSRYGFLSGRVEPLQEYTLEGKGREKVVVIPITGLISDLERQDIFQTRPSMLQELVSQLKKAEKDKRVRAVLLKIDSPGGYATVSDVLYNEILRFKQKTNAKVVVSMMNVAASGGYYVALPADHIMAHPTTVTGSVGVISMRLEAYELLEKIGLAVGATKSGDKKDMGSPFRQMTEEEKKIFQGINDSLARRFVGLVSKHRKLDSTTLADVKTGRIYCAEEALQIGLVDEIGYLNDALAKARQLAGLPADAKVVIYRTKRFPDDTVYNKITSQYPGGDLSLVNLGLFANMPQLQPGFYYLWSPGAWKD